MVLGDSTVLGRAVPQHFTVTARLEALLREKGLPAEVLNAGVAGYATDQVLLKIRQLVPLYRPDVVVYGFCANDLHGNALNNDHGIPKPRFHLRPDGSLVEERPDLAGARIRTLDRRWVRSSAGYRLAAVACARCVRD